MSTDLRVRVIVPHFYNESGDGGYGSCRRGNRLARGMALARCLGNILSLNRAQHDWLLNIAEETNELTPLSPFHAVRSIKIELHLFVCNDQWLNDIVSLDTFSSRLFIHRLNLANPRDLPLESVRRLLDMPSPADLSLYLEDDLVISDPMYLDKLYWFALRTDHKYILMPHRYEPTCANAPQKYFVDGPINLSDDTKSIWSTDEKVLMHGRFWDGSEVDFVAASNPHSGSFCLSNVQLLTVKNKKWPPEEFVGPLETAATGTVLDHFPIVKASWPCRNFLTIEHGNPSFLQHLTALPYIKKEQ